MNQIIVLEIKFNFGGGDDAIYPVVLADGKNMVLIDCGYNGFLAEIEKAMEEKNLRCSDLTHVLLTHHDHDHMGALAQLKQKYPHVQVVAGGGEAPYVSGSKKYLRLEQAEEMQPHLPEEEQVFGLTFCDMLRAVQPVEVDLVVSDRQKLNFCGGCTIIATPGHTEEHISVFVDSKKVMIAGDAAVVEDGKLVVANPQYAWDEEQAQSSLEKILSYGAEEIICYHGGVFKV